MNCAISGEICDEPAISAKSGHVFERRLIEKHLKETGKCPITDVDLTTDDLIAVKNVNQPIRPRPASATSLGSLLRLFQNEWDAVMLETYSLKQHLDNVRQELSHALYQHDAACRVIARLIKERDEARQALADTVKNMSVAVSDNVREQMADNAKAAAALTADEAQQLSPAVIELMQIHAKKLSKSRKKRSKIAPPNLAQESEIADYDVTASHPLHGTSEPGITCLDLHVDETRVATGGIDAQVIVFNRETKKIEATIKAHKKKISAVKFHPSREVVLSSSYDNTAKVWTRGGGGDADTYTASAVSRCHTAPVTALSLHPTGDYYATTSLDKSWCVLDLGTGSVLQKIVSAEADSPHTVFQFHPDGMIGGMGSRDTNIRIWDVLNRQILANFEGHESAVTALAFSENGYHLASSDEGGVVKLWDLRKLANLQTLEPTGEGAVHSLAYDYSGTYLTVGGPNVSVYNAKTWSVVKRFDDHSKAVTSVGVARDARFFVSASMDRSVKFYANEMSD